MAPVYHGQWAFNGYTLYVTTSSGEVHPRATYSELDEIFTTPIGDRTNIPDYQDHWYEAQLLHFGLAPTKRKATAKMRLMDAFQDGALEIPMEILRIEATLRRNWIKQDLDSHLLGPSIQPSLGRDIAEAMDIDTTDVDTTQKQEGEEEGSVSGAGLAGGAGMQGNMRSQQNKTQLPHAHPKRKKSNNSELSTRPMKTVRCRGETGGSDLQVQIDDNTDGEAFHQRSTVTPVSVGNSCGRPGPDRELQQVEYQTVPPLHQTTYGMGTQLPPPGLMGTDGASDYCDYGYKPAMNWNQFSLVVGWSFKNRNSVAKT
ncbi:hypothetical protein N7449_006749 [Penicillium cf. viridicatum]|uniref:Uncharacterized protein n=1 Tax=Penicillium cf. viridicatum TaxID=2972119 RepID=A0A9W9MBE8_9EURO|nr:hypothetical protein N7449_006749 [Penicillium cf. viridicatum]